MGLGRECLAREWAPCKRRSIKNKTTQHSRRQNPWHVADATPPAILHAVSRESGRLSLSFFPPFFFSLQFAYQGKTNYCALVAVSCVVACAGVCVKGNQGATLSGCFSCVV
jgi:hypothetical protein